MQKSYCDLLDSLDGGYGAEVLEFSSALPGLKRSVYLASQTQLHNLVNSVSLALFFYIHVHTHMCLMPELLLLSPVSRLGWCVGQLVL